MSTQGGHRQYLFVVPIWQETDLEQASIWRGMVEHVPLNCMGNTASLYANGNIAVATEMDGPSQGSGDFAARRATEAQTDLPFDNFAVFVP